MHIADVSYFVPAGSPLDRGAAERALSTYVPGPRRADAAARARRRLCSCGRTTTGSASRSRCRSTAVEPGEPSFYRSVIRSRERLTYGRAEAILAGRERAAPSSTEALRLADAVALELARRRFARGALRIAVAPRSRSSSTGDGGVERGVARVEPHAHMLVEELMILANEAVAGLLAGRRREALFRVHERPEPQAVDAAAGEARRPRACRRRRAPDDRAG